MTNVNRLLGVLSVFAFFYFGLLIKEKIVYSEGKLKKDLKKKLTSSKRIRLHANSASAFTEHGWPDWDIIIYYPDLGSKTLRAECKAEGRKLSESPDQLAKHKQLIKEKIPVVVIIPINKDVATIGTYDGKFMMEFNVKDDPVDKFIDWAKEVFTSKTFTHNNRYAK